MDPNKSWTRGATWTKYLKRQKGVKIIFWVGNISFLLEETVGERKRERKSFFSMIHGVPSVGIRRDNN